MKVVKYVFAILLLTLFILTNLALAADVAKIGVVDLQKILETSRAGKAIQDQLKKEKEGMESDLFDFSSFFLQIRLHALLLFLELILNRFAGTRSFKDFL